MANLTEPPQPTTREVGFSLAVRSFLIQADGLPTVRVNDLVETDSGARGWVNALLTDRVQILMLDDVVIEPRTMFKKSGHTLTVTPGKFLIGRAISPIGTPIDGQGPLTKKSAALQLQEYPLELDRVAPGIGSRQFIDEQFDTGITLIDTLIPLGKGQRELIIGDARSGKTRFLVDLVHNLHQSGAVVIYTLIGKPTAAVRNLLDILTNTKAFAHTIVIAASSNDAAPLIFLAPHTALTIAEYFQKQGQDVLVILDDLGNHAKVHREISLLSNKFPGREAYPGDIFYQHAHLMERAGKFTPDLGGGSITLLPVIEINLNDFTTYIPNNLMSMTDGHLLFKSDLAATGQFPAIDLSLSVSRVGRQTQNRLQNAISYKLKQVLSSAAEYETLSRFAAELPQETQVILRQKEIIYELIRQAPLTNIPKAFQTILMALVFTNFLKFKDIPFIRRNYPLILAAFDKEKDLNAVVKGVFKFKSETELISKLESLGPRLQQVCK